MSSVRPRPMAIASAAPQDDMRMAGIGVQDRIGPASA